jgi:hypothetical protein
MIAKPYMPACAYYVLRAGTIPIYHHGSEKDPCTSEIESL